MKSFQRRWKGLEITIVAVLVLLLLLLAYLNCASAILALIIVVAAYLVNYNTLHNRRRLAREQFSAMMKNVTQASNFALQNQEIKASKRSERKDSAKFSLRRE